MSAYNKFLASLDKEQLALLTDAKNEQLEADNGSFVPENILTAQEVSNEVAKERPESIEDLFRQKRPIEFADQWAVTPPSSKVAIYLLPVIILFPVVLWALNPLFK